VQIQRTGIVIKQFHSMHKVALFDSNEGRFDAVIKKPMHVGSMIEYSIGRRSGTTVYLDSYSLIDLPFDLAKDDLLFWHHVLELCYYFVPLGSYTPQLFELCAFLYTIDSDALWNVQSKKLYLFKLLTTIGLYPRLPQLSLAKMHYFMALDLHAIAFERVDAQHEQLLDDWLRLCVAQHVSKAGCP
jgi:hypothetical protein